MFLFVDGSGGVESIVASTLYRSIFTKIDFFLFIDDFSPLFDEKSIITIFC